MPQTEVPVSGGKELGLAQVIRSVKNAIRQSENQPPPMDIQKVRDGVEFALTKSAAGVISFTVVGAGAKVSQQDTRHITFYMSPK